MTSLFTIQLITAFLIGGGIIALLSLIAEKAPQKTAGIFLTLPSTVAVSLFFMAWTTSAQATAQIIPSTLIPMGSAILFGAIYAAIAKSLKLKSKIAQISTTYTIGIAIWFALALPMAIYKINNLSLGLSGYLITIILAALIFKRNKEPKAPSLSYTKIQILGRSIFAGVIVALVVIFTKILNPFWGGIFAMFPAAFSSSLIIFHWYYPPKSLSAIINKAPIGSISMLVYVLAVMSTFPKFGFITGTIIAYLLSFATTLTLSKLQ